MRYLWLVVMTLIVFGCQHNAEVDQTQEEPPAEEVKQAEPEKDYEPEPEQVSEEKIVGEIEKTPSEPVVNPIISLGEAREIAEENFAQSIGLMQELQEENNDWFGVEPDSDAYVKGVSATKEQLNNQISESVIDQWAETYFEEFFLDNHLYDVLHPSGMNTRFDLKEFTDDKFTLSYIQLGDEAYSETMKYDVTFLKEEETWKFAGYNSEKIRQPLDLTEKDLIRAFVHYETLERYEGELVDEEFHEGEKYLIMDYGEVKRAINSRTGQENPFLLEDTDS